MFILKDTSLQKYIYSIRKLVNNPKLAQKMRTNSFKKLKQFYDLKQNQNILFNKIKEDSKLNKYLNNKNIQKKIFIPNKLINIITS